ncbi:hypothetical protein T261_05630 [Streptomyces lydicus]|uniref:Uncharacterized protein n=1 Tax=Streptomyces chattanoogensis TaxID=66876 RepID=A0A0N0XS77_9ACTN|nr:hypothetical protein T261_05630 [Streptomyces lydicus]KPC58973.1 hypothetical protein ADL29_38090 [Streptomyces chattanoogensis]
MALWNGGGDPFITALLPVGASVGSIGPSLTESGGPGPGITGTAHDQVTRAVEGWPKYPMR